jgi:hypothetical protein
MRNLAELTQLTVEMAPSQITLVVLIVVSTALLVMVIVIWQGKVDQVRLRQEGLKIKVH